MAANATALGRMLREAKDASERFAQEGNVQVSWERLWQIEPVLFNKDLIGLCDEAIGETCGKRHRHVPLLVSPWAYSTYRGS